MLKLNKVNYFLIIYIMPKIPEDISTKQNDTYLPPQNLETSEETRNKVAKLIELFEELQSVWYEKVKVQENPERIRWVNISAKQVEEVVQDIKTELNNNPVVEQEELISKSIDWYRKRMKESYGETISELWARVRILRQIPEYKEQINKEVIIYLTENSIIEMIQSENKEEHAKNLITLWEEGFLWHIALAIRLTYSWLRNDIKEKILNEFIGFLEKEKQEFNKVNKKSIQEKERELFWKYLPEDDFYSHIANLERKNKDKLDKSDYKKYTNSVLLPEAKSYIDNFKREKTEKEYEELIDNLYQAWWINKKLTEKSSGIDCNDKTSINITIATEFNSLINEFIDVNDHASLKIRNHPLICDTFDTRIRCIEEFWRAQEYWVISNDSYFISTPTEYYIAKYDWKTHWKQKLIQYEKQENQPFSPDIAEYIAQLISDINVENNKEKEIYEFALLIKPYHLYSCVNFSNKIFFNEEDFKKVEGQLKIILQKDNKNAHAYKSLWILYQWIFSQYWYEKSLELLERAIDITPNDSDLYVELGKLYINKIKDNDKALKYLQKAVRLDKNNTSALLYLGISYKLLNRVQEAIASLEQGLTLAPDNGTICYELAAIYEDKLSDYNRALIFYERYSELNPNTWFVKDKIDEVKKKLNSKSA